MPGFNPNDYEPVDARLHRFWEDVRAAKLTATVETDLVEIARDKDGKPLQYVVRTTIQISDGRRATGLAEELVGSSPVNRTSALENAETSSTGRALAQLGYSPKGARPSREEMEKADRAEHPVGKGNGKVKPVLKAVEPVPAAPAADQGAVADPQYATNAQWAKLVALFGGKNAVLKEANHRFEGVVQTATDLTLLQAQTLIDERTGVGA